jgi:serine/threonine protein kinase
MVASPGVSAAASGGWKPGRAATTVAFAVPHRASHPETDERAEELVGTIVSDRYRLDELIALGGMGAVYRAEHVHLHKVCAIKILHPIEERALEVVARFRREAIVGGHIQHPNIAAATDFGELDDGSHFLVTEFIHGATLHTRMLAGPIDGDIATQIALQISLALGALHDKGIVHRDLKPRNIMIADDAFATVKVIDFGLAKVDLARLPTTASAEKTSLTEGGVIFGTVAYMPPEAALGMDVMDARADLYALGVILYEMLAGKHLFDGSPGELFVHHRKTAPLSFATRAPEVRIHPAIEAVVMRLLEKDPSARYPNATELVRALDEARATVRYPPYLPTRSASSSRPAHPSRPARANVPTAPRLPELGRDSDRTPLRFGEGEGVRMSDPTPLRFSDQPTQPRLPGDPPRRPAKTVSDADPKDQTKRHLVLAILLALLLVSMLVALFRGPWLDPRPEAVTSASATVPPPPATATATATAAATATATATATEEETDPSPPAAKASETSRSIRQAAASRRWARAAELVVELVDEGGADELADEPTRIAARDAASEQEDRGEGRGDAVFAALVRAGAPGLDVLYDIVQTKGKTRAQARADAVLKKSDNIAKASPALRIAIELRNAQCDKKRALFDRAVEVGDVRALTVLETFGVGCFKKDKRLMNAIHRLKERLAKP